MHVETMLYAKISHDGHAGCPSLLKELTYQDGSPIDPTVFTVTDLTS